MLTAQTPLHALLDLIHENKGQLVFPDLSAVPDANLAWLAGLYEGEGSIVAVQRSNTASPTLGMAIKMTDLDVLERARDTVALGTVFGPYQSSYVGAKPHWSWNVQKAGAVFSLATALYPWLGERRQGQIVEKVTFWASHRDGRRRAA
jgi:hypothetical protein